MFSPMSWQDLMHKHSLNAATAALFGLAIWRIGLSPELPAVFAFIFGGVLLAVIDWRIQRLPSRIIYFTLAGVAAGLVFASIVERDVVPLATAVARSAVVHQRLLRHLVCDHEVHRDDGARIR